MPTARTWKAQACLLLVLAGGCGRVEPPPLSIPAPFGFEELKQNVAKIRGLPLQREVAIESRSAGAIEAYLEEHYPEEHGKEKTLRLAHAYQQLGLLPLSADPVKAFGEVRALEHMTIFDARKNAIVLHDQAFRFGPPLIPSAARQSNPALGQIPWILALARALQEQNFHWQEKLRASPLEDRRLALRALVQGDAALVALAHVKSDQQSKALADGVRGIARWAAEIDRDFAAVPELLRHKFVFPYLAGSQFALWAYSAKGWEGINALYSDPPTSTSQILHPEKYYLKREKPLQIIPWGLIHRMNDTSAIEETLGESLLPLLLAPPLRKDRAGKIAAGWKGDHLSVYRQEANLVLAWITSWKDAQNAQEFHRSYRSALERHHRIAFASVPGSEESLASPPTRGGPLYLQVKGSFVLLLAGWAAPRAPEVAQQVWKDLETRGESIPLSYDAAKLQGHRSLTSR